MGDSVWFRLSAGITRSSKGAEIVAEFRRIAAANKGNSSIRAAGPHNRNDETDRPTHMLVALSLHPVQKWVLADPAVMTYLRASKRWNSSMTLTTSSLIDRAGLDRARINKIVA